MSLALLAAILLLPACSGDPTVHVLDQPTPPAVTAADEDSDVHDAPAYERPEAPEVRKPGGASRRSGL